MPNGDRTEEVIVSQQVLQALELRSFTPQVTACPGCGRTTSTFFQDMADQIQNYLRQQMPVWKESHTGVEEMKVAVMGCVVNGPGESKHSNIGISLPGTFEEPVAPVYVDGKLKCTLRGDRIVAEFIEIFEIDYVVVRALRRPNARRRRGVAASCAARLRHFKMARTKTSLSMARKALGVFIFTLVLNLEAHLGNAIAVPRSHRVALPMCWGWPSSVTRFPTWSGP